MDISSRLSTNEQIVDQLRDKVAEVARRPQTLSLTYATLGTSIGHTRRLMTGPRHADHEAIAGISDKVRVKVSAD